MPLQAVYQPQGGIVAPERAIRAHVKGALAYGAALKEQEPLQVRHCVTLFLGEVDGAQLLLLMQRSNHARCCAVVAPRRQGRGGEDCQRRVQRRQAGPDGGGLAARDRPATAGATLSRLPAASRSPMIMRSLPASGKAWAREGWTSTCLHPTASLSHRPEASSLLQPVRDH